MREVVRIKTPVVALSTLGVLVEGHDGKEMFSGYVKGKKGWVPVGDIRVIERAGIPRPSNGVPTREEIEKVASLVLFEGILVSEE